MRRRIKLTPLRRHLAAIITIALSTAFVAVMFAAGTVMQDSVTGGSEAKRLGADLVVTPVGSDNSPEEGVHPPEILQAAYMWPDIGHTVGELRGKDGLATTVFPVVIPPKEVAPTRLIEGRHAQADGEVVVDQSVADVLRVGVGDTVMTSAFNPEKPNDSGSPLTIVGIMAPRSSALTIGAPLEVALTEYSDVQLTGVPYGDVSNTVTWNVALKDGVDAEQAAEDLHGKVGMVQTVDVALEKEREQATGGFAALGVIFGSFVAIALITAAVVTANTFTVTLAQRTRDLALLRTLGATGGQVSTTVLRESLLVGVLGSVAGVLLGHLAVQVLLALSFALGWVSTLVPVPFSVASVVVPILAGIIISVFAGLLPLRRAVSVKPLQALRPTPPQVGHRFGLGEFITTVIALIGFALLAGGTVEAVRDKGSIGFGVLIAILGGAVSLFGVLLCLGFLVGPFTRLTGILVRPLGGLPARLATANALRNPGRSAATVAALVIGTTLMSLMAVGASTAETTLTQDLTARKPIDMVVRADALPEQAASQLKSVEGVTDAEAIPTEELRVIEDIGADTMTTYGVTPEQIDRLSAREGLGDLITPGVLLTGEDRADTFGLSDGQKITVTGTSGTPHEFTVRTIPALTLSLTTPEDLKAVEDDQGTQALFVALDRNLGTTELAEAGTKARSAVMEMEGAQNPRVQLPGVERSVYSTVLQVLLGITVALLAVAVVVALVGVANTLTLSVIERTGENALLRALGTTRGQMRAMLGWEGVLLGLVGSMIGVLLGSLYGAVGATAILGKSFTVAVSFPWVQLAALLVLSILAGWLASVLPARRAARTAPAEALSAS